MDFKGVFLVDVDVRCVSTLSQFCFMNHTGPHLKSRKECNQQISESNDVSHRHMAQDHNSVRSSMTVVLWWGKLPEVSLLILHSNLSIFPLFVARIVWIWWCQPSLENVWGDVRWHPVLEGAHSKTKWPRAQPWIAIHWGWRARQDPQSVLLHQQQPGQELQAG